MKWNFLIVFLINSAGLCSQSLKVYLLPGQGSDYRIFQNISFPENVDTVNLQVLIPEKNEQMHAYAKRMSAQIDTTSPFVLIGVSFGGMVAVEMTDFISPEKIIIISSASSREELPQQYRSMESFPIHKLIGKNIYKSSAFILQPLYEYDRKKVKKTCTSMLRDKDGLFIKRVTNCIVTWDRNASDNSEIPVIHIHGDRDNTLPIENIRADYVIHGGSHLMTLTMPAEISSIICFELSQLN